MMAREPSALWLADFPEDLRSRQAQFLFADPRPPLCSHNGRAGVRPALPAFEGCVDLLRRVARPTWPSVGVAGRGNFREAPTFVRWAGSWTGTRATPPAVCALGRRDRGRLSCAFAFQPVGMLGPSLAMTLPVAHAREPACKAIPGRAARGEVSTPIEFAFSRALNLETVARQRCGPVSRFGWCYYLAARRPRTNQSISRAAGKSTGQPSPLAGYSRAHSKYIHGVQLFPEGRVGP